MPSIKCTSVFPVSSAVITSGVGRQVCGETVGLGGHDKVVPVQTTNLMRPPGYGDATPLREERRVVALRFGKRADLVGELKGLGEILQAKDALELAHAVALDDLPLGNLRLELGDFLIGNLWRIGPACRAGGLL